MMAIPEILNETESTCILKYDMLMELSTIIDQGRREHGIVTDIDERETLSCVLSELQEYHEEKVISTEVYEYLTNAYLDHYTEVKDS